VSYQKPFLIRPSLAKGVSLLTILSLTLIGCSHQEFSTPYTDLPAAAVGDRLDPRDPYLDASKSAAQMRMERLADVLAKWQSKNREEAEDYIIGPDDILEVNVFALEAPGKTSTLIRPVSQDGFITMPWIGSLQASGLSRRQLEERIKAAYSGKYIKDPQVTVSVSEYRSTPVVVTGAVGKPGVYYLTANRSTVLAVLAQAGGLKPEAGDELLITRPGDPRKEAADLDESGKSAGGDKESSREQPKVIALDLKELIDKGNFALNLEVESGDILTVSPQSPEYIYVLGYVRSPAALELKNGIRVDAVQAVAMAGGLTATARAENSFLIRKTREGQKIIKMDLTKITRGIRPPVYMESGDTLVIGTDFLGRLSEFLKPSISAGANFSGLP